MPDQVMTTDKPLDDVKAGLQTQSATDEVTSILARSSAAERNAIYSSMQGSGDTNVASLLGLTNDIDLFLGGTSDSGQHDGRIDSKSLGPDVLKINDANTTTYLGRDGEFQSFEQLAGGKVSVRDSEAGGQNVRSYELNGITGKGAKEGEYLTENGSITVLRDGTREYTNKENQNTSRLMFDKDGKPTTFQTFDKDGKALSGPIDVSKAEFDQTTNTLKYARDGQSIVCGDDTAQSCVPATENVSIDLNTGREVVEVNGATKTRDYPGSPSYTIKDAEGNMLKDVKHFDAKDGRPERTVTTYGEDLSKLPLEEKKSLDNSGVVSEPEPGEIHVTENGETTRYWKDSDTDQWQFDKVNSSGEEVADDEAFGAKPYVDLSNGNVIKTVED